MTIVTKLLAGGFEVADNDCNGDWNHFRAATLEEATRHLQPGSYTFIDETVDPELTVAADGRCNFFHADFDRAIQLRLHRGGRLQPGRRYRVRVEFDEVESTFLGEGI